MNNERSIETDSFDFAFLSQVAERESWRKEVHRPIYHIHKWWAKRLGTIFRGILLGCILEETADISREFYVQHDFKGRSVFDPFMGSGTTIGEAHKLGLTAFGRDINPVAVNAVRVALGPLNRRTIQEQFQRLSDGIGDQLRGLYRSKDSDGKPCDVLYHFWVMQTDCPHCQKAVDLFSSYVFARNAYPKRKPEVQVYCPGCGAVVESLHGCRNATCATCRLSFDPEIGPAKGAKARCTGCSANFSIIDAVKEARPTFRQYAKLVLRRDGNKEYMRVNEDDEQDYKDCQKRLEMLSADGTIVLPTLKLQKGHNTKQAMRYGFLEWRDFFNDRQLLALSLLRNAIMEVVDPDSRQALLTLFSGVLEFNNLFASYKGEGTGAVRHMFSHHILKPERMPIEANLWGTSKSSGSFSNLFRSRLLRAIDYRDAPTEVNGTEKKQSIVCSERFSGEIEEWGSSIPGRGIALSCGDSADTKLDDKSVDFVVTDPPFFDNVHYSELADFFHAWQQIGAGGAHGTTRHIGEVQDADCQGFAVKLKGVFKECERILKDDGLLVFSYHHSRDQGWSALAEAILGAGFVVVNSQPVKAEMSGATPKSHAKEPIQLDIIIVCRKASTTECKGRPTVEDAMTSSIIKLQKLHQAGFSLSSNDRKIVAFGQLLTTLSVPADAVSIFDDVTKYGYAITCDLTIPVAEFEGQSTSGTRPKSTSRKQSQKLLFD